MYMVLACRYEYCYIFLDLCIDRRSWVVDGIDRRGRAGPSAEGPEGKGCPPRGPGGAARTALGLCRRRTTYLRTYIPTYVVYINIQVYVYNIYIPFICVICSSLLPIAYFLARPILAVLVCFACFACLAVL